jgi:GNAT superfamily N-acetyltransferase
MSTHAIRIRRALESEASALSALALDAKQYWPYSRQDIERWRPLLAVTATDVAAKPTFVAELDGSVVGFYLLIPDMNAWALDHLWVSPSFARRAIGRALLAHAVTTARRAGASSIAIDADPNAEPFCTACGAVREGVIAAPIKSDPERIRPQLCLRIRDRAASPTEG